MGARLEDLFLMLGQPGRYQLLTVALLTYQYIFFIAYPTSLSFYLLKPKGYCDIKNITDVDENVAGELSQNETTSTSTQDHFVSFAMDWGYACGDSTYTVRIVQTSYFVGNMVGGMVFGVIADRFGRKPVASGTIITAGLIGVITYFTYNIYVFVMLKILQGIVFQGFNSASNCMKTEMLHSKFRSKVVSVADAFGLSLPMFYLAGLCPLVGHWRLVELGLCIPLLASAWSVWVTPESLRWLLKSKKRKEALELIRKKARINNLELPTNIEKEVDLIIAEIDDQSKLQRPYDIRDLFRTPRIAAYVLVCALSWFAWLLVNYGLMFSMGDLSGNVFINFVIFGVVDFVFRSTAFLYLRLCETRTLTFFSLFANGLLLLGIVIINAIPGLEHAAHAIGITTTTFAIMGRAFIGIFVVSTYLLLSEVFPTPLRATAYGIFAATGRVGALSASQVISLKDYTWNEFPFIIFGSVALAAGLLQLIIPPTKNKPMPNTIEDTLALHRKKNDDFSLQPTKV